MKTNELQLSPEEIQLLQVARRLGLVGKLLDQTRQAELAAQKRAAEEKAVTLAYQAYQAAVKATEGKASGVTIAITITVPYGDSERVTAVYPPPSPRSKTKTTSKQAVYPDGLVEELKEEARRRGAKWYGVQNAVRTQWGRQVYERFMSSPDSAPATISDSAE
jgi:hypothetical protein